jgi:5S rRNA maturation endonuclease (ribonuclease M5)
MFGTEEITKEEILSKISQEEIFKAYLTIEPEYGIPFKNPLREDEHPKCFFYVDNYGMIKFNDFAKRWNWDCFEVVCKLYNCNFYTALRIIAKDFNIRNIEIKGDFKRAKNLNHLIKKEIITFKVKIREWKDYDLKYWSQFNINKKILNFYNVAPLEIAIMVKGTKENWIYKQKNNLETCYMYNLGNGKMKIYIPQRSRDSQYPRFYHNCPNHVQGFDQLPPIGDTLVITKAQKDVMSLFSFGIDSIANMSESIILSEKVMNNLKNRFKIIYTLYDRDSTGISLSKKMKKEYDTIPLLLKEGDFTDYFKNNGMSKTVNLVNKFKKWNQLNLKKHLLKEENLQNGF